MLDCKELKPQGIEGQEAIRVLLRLLSRQPFAKGMILRGNAMTCMQLARLLRRIETEPTFLARLRAAVARRRAWFGPARELAAWKALLDEVARPL